MTALHLTIPVPCPPGQTQEYLERYFAEQSPDGDQAVIALRAPISLPGLPEIAPVRDCVVRASRSRVPGEMIPRYAVSWESAGGGPYPKFRGTVSIPNDEDYRSCFIALDGEYEPPGGAAGQAFDAALGRAIANSTGRDLLTRIAAYITQSARSAETAKANARAAES